MTAQGRSRSAADCSDLAKKCKVVPATSCSSLVALAIMLMYTVT
jgi:hypothetical protein